MHRELWLFESYSDNDDIEAVTSVLSRGLHWSNGPEIAEFEQKIADRAGKQYGISFNTGTSALYALLLAYNVRGGEVIVPSFTFPATANAVIAAGAKPVFADIEDETLALDSEDVEKKINEYTRAIMPIHFAGDVCRDIKMLVELAARNRVPLIEDAAHSLGTLLGNECVGSFGNTAMFSFCFNKVLTTGEGGMIVTDSDDIQKQLKLLRSHGRNQDGDYITYGFNFRMSSMTAALGLSQFSKLDRLISRRREMAQYLNGELKSVHGIKLPIPGENHYHVYQTYNIQLIDRTTRDGLKEYLSSKGVPTRITYKPVHLYSYYKNSYGCKEGDLPVTENVSARILTLPFHLNLDKSNLDYIIQAIKEFMGNI